MTLAARDGETATSDDRLHGCMCQYCVYSFSEGWTALLQYDDVYQNAIGGQSESTHGFHESWDELRAELEL